MTKRSWIAVVVAVLAGATVWFFYVREKPPVLQEVTVEAERFQQNVAQSGTIQPENKISVNAPIAGRIDKLLLQEGNTVKRGQIIAWMSSTDRAALLDSASSQGSAAVKEMIDVYKPTPIISPMTGVIISRAVVVGQTVTNSTVLFELSDRLIVMADVDETDLGKIKVGQSATVKVDSFPDNVLRAKVVRIAHQSVSKSSINVYPVLLEPETIPPEFRAGLTASVYFELQDIEKALTLPTWVAEGRDNFEGRVRVKGAEEPRKVKFGASNGQKIVVLEGLKEGEVVLVKEQKFGGDSKSSSAPFGIGAPRGGRRR